MDDSHDYQEMSDFILQLLDKAEPRAMFFEQLTAVHENRIRATLGSRNPPTFSEFLEETKIEFDARNKKIYRKCYENGIDILALEDNRAKEKYIRELYKILEKYGVREAHDEIWDAKGFVQLEPLAAQIPTYQQLAYFSEVKGLHRLMLEIRDEREIDMADHVLSYPKSSDKPLYVWVGQGQVCQESKLIILVSEKYRINSLFSFMAHTFDFS